MLPSTSCVQSLKFMRSRCFPHVLSETFIIPFHEPIPAQKRDVELPPQVLGRNPTARAECDSLIDFSAQLCAPYCVELSDPKRISLSTVAALNRQIAEGLHLRQWLLAVATIRL